MEERYKKENFWNKIGIFLGICILVAGLYMLLNPVNGGFYTTVPDSVTFGADFYTDIYEAAQNIARNTSSAVHMTDDILDAVNRYAALAFVAFGLVTIVYFSRKRVLCSISMDLEEEKSQYRKKVMEMLRVQNEEQFQYHKKVLDKSMAQEAAENENSEKLPE